MMALTPEQIHYLNQYAPGEAVSHALSELLFIDHDLLGIDANERSITFRFAMYLQQCFPGWTVDCEYNRDGIEPKRLRHLELYPDSEDVEAKTVFPDVTCIGEVHDRIIWSWSSKNQRVASIERSIY